jgi:hypothetical protein
VFHHRFEPPCGNAAAVPLQLGGQQLTSEWLRMLMAAVQACTGLCNSQSCGKSFLDVSLQLDAGCTFVLKTNVHATYLILRFNTVGTLHCQMHSSSCRLQV